MTNKKYDIHGRIFTFIVEVIKFVQSLPRTPANIAIIGQIIPSVTSMGANDQEADGALSNKEFIHKFGIVRKEGEEIVAIVSRIISNAKKTSVKRKK